MIQIKQFITLEGANEFLAVLQDSDVKRVDYSLENDSGGAWESFTIVYRTTDPAIQENIVELKRARVAKKDKLDKP